MFLSIADVLPDAGGYVLPGDGHTRRQGLESPVGYRWRFPQKNTMSFSRIHPATALIVVLGLLNAFAPFSTDMYLASFPAIAQTFHTDAGSVQQSLSAFMLGQAIGQIFYGPLTDRFGRRAPLLGGVALFTLSSVGCIFSAGIGSFVAMRFMQAVGACSGMVISRAIVQDHFEEREAVQALSSLMVVQGIGPVLAPILGGYLFGWFGWESVFVFLAAFGILSLWLIMVAVPETLPPAQRRAQSVKEIAGAAWQLMCHREFIVPTLAASIGMSAIFVYISGAPFVIMDLFGVSAQHFGWIFGANAIGMTAAVQINRSLARRYSAGQILHVAVLIQVVASVLVLLAIPTHSLWLFMLPLFGALAMVPVIGANGTAIAMRGTGNLAGTGSSLFGVLFALISCVVCAVLSLLQNGTAWPMAGLILGCAVLAALSMFGGRASRAAAEGARG